MIRRIKIVTGFTKSTRDILRCQFKYVWYRGRNLSVDESLVLYKWRLAFRQYIKTKRAHFGIKLYELTTSEGITLDFLVYCGRGMFHNDDPYSNMSTTERIPSVLMGPYFGKGHIIYTDNWYTSPTLSSFFLSKQTLCGTVRRNRKHFPSDIDATELPRGSSIFMKHVDGRPMLACKFHALEVKACGKPKVVYMLSTCHDALIQKTGKVDHITKIEIEKLQMTIEYNKHMGGVDRVDQQLHSYKFLRKSYKWYKKPVFRLFSQGILNAHKVFKRVTVKRKVTFCDFFVDTVTLLITQDVSPLVNHNICNDDTLTRLTGSHLPSLKKATPGAIDKRATKPCRVCSARKLKTAKDKPLKTVYICAQCPSQPGLHPDICYEAYHTQLNYGE